MTILNAYTKKSGNLLKAPRIFDSWLISQIISTTIFVWIQKYFIKIIFVWEMIMIDNSFI